MIFCCVCRLKATAAYYGEFKGAQSTQGKGTSAIAAQAAAEKAGGNAARLSADDITRLLRVAVSSVLGASVADDRPLVEAGLDSLGEPTPLLRHTSFFSPFPHIDLQHEYLILRLSM